MEPLQAALQARDDLDRYGAAKRSLFALQLNLELEDIHTVATAAVTDGPDDKSCDIIYVDRDLHTAVVIQGYESMQPQGKIQAPLGKAASLHQAVSWLLADQRDSTIPERLQSARDELHDALKDGDISSLQVWFVHNLPESDQVSDEMTAIAAAAKGLLRGNMGIEDIDVTAVEIGLSRLNDRYVGSKTPILVTEPLDLDVQGAFLETGENWSAVCTTVPATWLHEQFQTHRERLFSANVRGYLGSTRSRGNINNGIQGTARSQPRHFWAYNNGITAIVQDFELEPEGKHLRLQGLAIVNGAQTTGSIGSLSDHDVGDVRVMARFIKCSDPVTVQEIIRFNNRQNPTQASDFRSNDRIQSRLVKEFEDLGVVGYNGGRRGGAEDVIRRPGANQILATVAAQALAAFHNRPDIAYHQKGQIWEEDAVYSSVFPERISARHILFTCALLRAVEERKVELSAQADLGDAESELLRWFSLRGSHMLAVSALGSVMEVILDRTIPDTYGIQFRRKLPIQEAVTLLAPTVEAGLALAPTMLSAPLGERGLRNRAQVDDSISRFRGLFVATKSANRAIYQELSRQIEVAAPPVPAG